MNSVAWITDFPDMILAVELDQGCNSNKQAKFSNKQNHYKRCKAATFTNHRQRLIRIVHQGRLNHVFTIVCCINRIMPLVFTCDNTFVHAHFS